MIVNSSIDHQLCLVTCDKGLTPVRLLDYASPLRLCGQFADNEESEAETSIILLQEGKYEASEEHHSPLKVFARRSGCGGASCRQEERVGNS